MRAESEVLRCNRRTGQTIEAIRRFGSDRTRSRYTTDDQRNVHKTVIVQVISNLEYGGAQRQVVELTNSLDPSRYDVHVCSLSPYVPLADELEDRARCLHVIRKTFKFDISVIPRLARLLRRVGAHVVHSYLFDADIAARLAGRLAGTPVIINSERNTDYHLKRRQLLAYRLTRGCLDRFIANSNAGAKFNSRALGHDIAMYDVVHNGVNTVRFFPQPTEEVRKEISLSAGDRVVGMFASFKEQKNHPLFFEAAKLVLQRVPRARFLFVGDELYGGMHGSDAYKERVERLVDELGLRKRCLFLGNRNDVARLYCACDVTVLSSLFEGTPNVVLESLACGVPVVATDVSDNRYLIPDGRVGFVVELGDEKALSDRICRLLEDDERRVEAGREARRWVEQEFSTTRLAEKTAAVYEAALASKSRNENWHGNRVRSTAIS